MTDPKPPQSEHPTPWRTGYPEKHWIYDANDKRVGNMMTADVATLVIDAVNGREAYLEALARRTGPSPEEARAKQDAATAPPAQTADPLTVWVPDSLHEVTRDMVGSPEQTAGEAPGVHVNPHIGSTELTVPERAFRVPRDPNRKLVIARQGEPLAPDEAPKDGDMAYELAQKVRDMGPDRGTMVSVPFEGLHETLAEAVAAGRASLEAENAELRRADELIRTALQSFVDSGPAAGLVEIAEESPTPTDRAKSLITSCDAGWKLYRNALEQLEAIRDDRAQLSRHHDDHHAEERKLHTAITELESQLSAAEAVIAAARRWARCPHYSAMEELHALGKAVDAYDALPPPGRVEGTKGDG